MNERVMRNEDRETKVNLYNISQLHFPSKLRAYNLRMNILLYEGSFANYFSTYSFSFFAALWNNNSLYKNLRTTPHMHTNTQMMMIIINIGRSAKLQTLRMHDTSNFLLKLNNVVVHELHTTRIILSRILSITFFVILRQPFSSADTGTARRSFRIQFPFRIITLYTKISEMQSWSEALMCARVFPANPLPRVSNFRYY